MMVSLLGSARQLLQALFLILYLIIQPVWEALKITAVAPALNSILSLLAAFAGREIPFD
jgi:hypothetical protein